MQSQSTVKKRSTDMTPTTSLDSVLKSSLSTAGHDPVEGERLADARAQVLSGTLEGPLDKQVDRFTRNPAQDTDDTRLNRALRALAAKYQATQASSPQATAAAAPSAPSTAPVAHPPAPAPAVGATKSTDTSSSSSGNSGSSGQHLGQSR